MSRTDDVTVNVTEDVTEDMTVAMCPDPTVLSRDVQTSVPCPMTGCGRVFPNTSSLRMHRVQSHGMLTTTSDSLLATTRCLPHNTARRQAAPTTPPSQCTVYHCPEPHCHYGAGTGRTFRTYKSVRQHYQRNHSAKNLPCSRCRRTFSLKRLLVDHEKHCGVMYECATCGVRYTSKQGLLKHQKTPYHMNRVSQVASPHGSTVSTGSQCSPVKSQTDAANTKETQTRQCVTKTPIMSAVSAENTQTQTDDPWSDISIYPTPPVAPSPTTQSTQTEEQSIRVIQAELEGLEEGWSTAATQTSVLDMASTSQYTQTLSDVLVEGHRPLDDVDWLLRDLADVETQTFWTCGPPASSSAANMETQTSLDDIDVDLLYSQLDDDPL